jgi:phi13 family phage major tail protein
MAGVKVGLKDLHIAILGKDGSYDTPQKFARAIDATITPNTNSTTLYADDQASEVAESMGDVEVEINVDDLSTEQYALLLGKTVNEDGVVVDKSDDVSPYLALLFRSLKSNGEYRYVVLYKGKFSIPEDSYRTKADQVEFVNQTLSAKFVSKDDGEWRARVDSDDPTVSPQVIDEWFDYVYGHMPIV